MRDAHLPRRGQMLAASFNSLAHLPDHGRLLGSIEIAFKYSTRRSQSRDRSTMCSLHTQGWRRAFVPALHRSRVLLPVSLTRQQYPDLSGVRTDSGTTMRGTSDHCDRLNRSVARWPGNVAHKGYGRNSPSPSACQPGSKAVGRLLSHGFRERSEPADYKLQASLATDKAEASQCGESKAWMVNIASRQTVQPRQPRLDGSRRVQSDPQ